MRRWCWLVAVIVLGACGEKETKPEVVALEESPAQQGAPAEAVDPEAPAQPGLLPKVATMAGRLDGVHLRYKPAAVRNYAMDFIQEGTQTGVAGRVIRRGVRQQMVVSRQTEATSGPEWKESLKFLDVVITPTETSDTAPAPKATPASSKEGDGTKEVKSGAAEKPAPGISGLMDRMASALKSTEFKLEITERGGVKSAVSNEAKGDAPNPMADSIRDMLRDATVVFPDRAVAPGESWEDKTEEKQDRAASHVLTKRTFKWTLVGWLPPSTECPSCVALKGDGQLERAGDLDIPGVKGTMAGRAVIRVEAVFNTEAGQLERLVMTATDGQTHNALNAGQQVTLTERMRIRLTMERKPIEQAPPQAPKEEKP